MTADFDVRRKRAAYRAARRGTKEMDTLIGRYADAVLSHLDGDGLDRFERLLAVADPTLQAWIFGKEPIAESEYDGLIACIRAFHGFDALERTAE